MAKELAPDMILFNNSVNLKKGKQNVNSINRKILKLRKLQTAPRQESNSNTTKLHPPVSSKINGKVSHSIGHDHIPEFVSA